MAGVKPAATNARTARDPAFRSAGILPALLPSLFSTVIGNRRESIGNRLDLNIIVKVCDSFHTPWQCHSQHWRWQLWFAAFRLAAKPPRSPKQTPAIYSLSSKTESTATSIIKEELLFNLNTFGARTSGTA